jgi:glycosyltransferase involved in cell wall biosynthesis
LFAALERWGCAPHKLRLNRTGIPLEDFPFAQRPMPADGAWRFVQASRLVAKKGLRTAVRAFARFRADNPLAKLVIAGEGPLREELEDLGVELGVRDAVEFRGFLSQADLAKLYAESHVFLHPSEMTSDKNQEGVPNSMLEAMATGLPILATNHGGIPEAVTHERHGLLVPESDVGALYGAMSQLTADPEMCYLWGQAASKQVRDEFEQRKAIEKLEDIYDEALAIHREKSGAS